MKNTIEKSNIFKLNKAVTATPGWLANQVSNGKWKYAEHISAIDKLLVCAANRKIRKLVINMPPRHGKSELISKYFTSWYLGNFPEHRIILASYESTFAESWGRKTRDLLKKHGLQLFGIEIDPKHAAAGDFTIFEHTGGMSCAGAGGAITGKGADLLIIDDPVKNDADANSAVIRDKIWDWFAATAFTRLEPDGICIIIMTRWHEDDLCGRLIKSGARFIDSQTLYSIIHSNIESEGNIKDEWLILKLPAIAGTADPLGRSEGEPLWKRRFPSKKLAEIKQQLGSYWFSSLYQQEPTPSGGGVIKRSSFKYFSYDGEYFKTTGIAAKTVKAADCCLFAVADLAAKTTEKSDFTVVLIFAVDRDRNIFILDVIREKFEGADHLNLMKGVFERYRPVLIGIEAVQYQISLVQSALREGLPVKELRADKDKMSRLLPMVARLESGSVYFRENASWLYDFENELLLFPNGRNDDQVDTFAYAGYMIQPISDNKPVSAHKPKSGKNKIFENFF